MKKVLKLFLAIPICLVFCFGSFGQNNLEDVAYLKNGSIIRGIIVEQVPFQSIKIQTKDGSLFVFKLEDIEKITKEVEYKNIDKLAYKTEGFINITEFSFCPGVGKKDIGDFPSIPNKDYSFGVRTINGYQPNSNFSVGIGIGVDKYEKESFMPLTFDIRYYILKGKVSPVLNANFGYSIGLNDFEGGAIINPSVGFKISVSKSISYVFNLGYKWQAREYYSSYKFRNNPPLYNYEIKSQFYQFLSFSTGLSF